MKATTFIILFITFSTIGVFARYKITGLHPSFWLTAFCNFIGCFAIGIFFKLKQSQMIEDKIYILAALVFLGALTTFSSYILDVFKLFLEKNYLDIFTYILASHLICVTACYIGYQMTARYIN